MKVRTAMSVVRKDSQVVLWGREFQADGRPSAVPVV